jgi:hypothetical protein
VGFSCRIWRRLVTVAVVFDRYRGEVIELDVEALLVARYPTAGSGSRGSRPEAAPAAIVADERTGVGQLGPEQPNHALDRRVIEHVADGADRWRVECFGRAIPTTCFYLSCGARCMPRTPAPD